MAACFVRARDARDRSRPSARYLDARSALRLGLASKAARALVHKNRTIWRTVALTRFPRLDDGRRRSADEWRAAYHFASLAATRTRPMARLPPPTSGCVPRLRRELKDLFTTPPPGVYACPRDEVDFLRWIGTLTGPPESPYEGGRFRLSLQFPPEYPLAPPKVHFLTAIFHPNVDARAGRGRTRAMCSSPFSRERLFLVIALESARVSTTSREFPLRSFGTESSSLAEVSTRPL